jgi:hypothetical protein
MKTFVRLVKRQAMNESVGVKVQSREFLISALYVDEMSASSPRFLIPCGNDLANL